MVIGLLIFGKLTSCTILWVAPFSFHRQVTKMARDGLKDVLNRLENLLQQNRLVSITVDWQARRTCHVVVLDGELQLATGLAFLSHKTKAPLLPVFTVRESDGHFTTGIERPLNDRPGAAANGDIEATISKYAALLEKYALECPAQYLGGSTMVALSVRPRLGR